MSGRPRGSIRDQILASFMLAVLMIGFFTLSTFYAQRRFSHNYEVIYRENRRIHQLQADVAELLVLLEQYIATKDTDLLMKIHESLPRLEEQAATWSTPTELNETGMMWRDVGFILANLTDKASRALVARMSNQTAEYTRLYEQAVGQKGLLINHSERLNKRLQEHNNERLSVFMARQSLLQGITFFIYVLIAGVCYWLIRLRTNRVTRPIGDMALAAADISGGNYDAQDIHADTGNEVDILADAFNAMKYAVRENFAQQEHKAQLELNLKEEQMHNLRLQNALQEAEFKALQAQIKPHFLFNTLNTGVQLAYLEGAERTVVFLEHLSTLFRYHLRDGLQAVTLAQELEYAKIYMYILEQRFGDAIEYQHCCRVSQRLLQGTTMPAMVLQPLLENSFQHGIRSLERGRIRLTAEERGNDVVITVSDDGVGMPPDRLGGILREPRPGGGTGIGLENVDRRLRLFTGGRALRITSSPGRGTTVTVTLKQEQEVSPC